LKLTNKENYGKHEQNNEDISIQQHT